MRVGIMLQESSCKRLYGGKFVSCCKLYIYISFAKVSFLREYLMLWVRSKLAGFFRSRANLKKPYYQKALFEL